MMAMSRTKATKQEEDAFIGDNYAANRTLSLVYPDIYYRLLALWYCYKYRNYVYYRAQMYNCY